MTKLYEIANDYAALMNEDMDPELIADTIEGMEGELSDKIENILAMIKNNKAESDALKAEAKSLTERAKACENKNESLKRYLASALDTMERKSFTAGIHKVSLRAGVKSVRVDNVDDIPAEYVEMRTEFVPDKKAILNLLKAGEQIEGVTMVTGKQSVLIK